VGVPVDVIKSLLASYGLVKPLDQIIILGWMAIFIIAPLLWLQNKLYGGGEPPPILIQLALLVFHIAVFALGCFVIFIIGKGALLILYTPIPGW
jgi:hypothetical protein